MPEPGGAAALPLRPSGSVVTVGTFDGVHLGHQDVLRHLRERALALDLPSVVVTFEPHPLQIVSPERAPLLLTSMAEKYELLANLGINYVLVLPFTDALRRFSAAEFVGRVLVDMASVRELLVGHDHGFGHGRSGDAAILRSIGEENGFTVSVLPPVMDAEGENISSTVVRRAVERGALERVRDLLGRPYALSGRVVRGAGRGRTVGYPTINVELQESRKLLPPVGVYAAVAYTPAGTFGAMLNVGPRPTFGETEVAVEAHLFDADAELYDSSVKLELVTRLRDVIRFAGVAELRAQLGRDASGARAALTKWYEDNNISSFTRH